MNELIKAYREHAIAQDRALMRGDYAAADREQLELNKVAESLLRDGELNLIGQLLDDEEVWIQIWAATHYMAVDEERSLAKLRDLLTSSVSRVAEAAAYLLNERQIGNLPYRQRSSE